MEKKKQAIEKLLSGDLNLEDKNDKNSLYLDITEKLGISDKTENAKAVAAVLKVEELTGKEPEFEDPSGTGVKRCLGQDIRDGLVTPSEESLDIYEKNKGEAIPGKKDLSDQEIVYRDIEIGLKESGYQSGKKPSSQDQMALDLMGGKAEDSQLSPAPFEESEAQMSFGPSKIIKGLLTQDLDEVKKGIEETTKVGALDNLRDALHSMAPAFSQVNKFLDSIGPNAQERIKNGFTGAGDIMETRRGGLSELFGKDNPISQESLDELREKMSDLTSKGTALVGEITESFKSGKMGKEMQGLIDISKEGSLEDVENHVEGMFDKLGKKLGLNKKESPEGDEEKKPERPQPQEPDWSERLAGRIAGAATYKAGRSKGLGAKNAGELSAVAEEEATDIAKSTKEDDKSRDKSVDMAKDTKNMAAKTAASIADKVPAPPGLGKAIAVGIIVVDKATDFLMDIINNKGGLESLNKAGGSLEQATPEPQEKGKGIEAIGGPGSGVGAGAVEIFQSQMKKTKGGIVKKLVPAPEDVFSSAMKGAVDGIGSWGKEEFKGKKKQVDDFHKQVDQPT
jgi:hypothetical protein